MKNNVLHSKPGLIDAFLLSLFAVIVTWQPFFLHGRRNFFELGIYLPGIDAVLKGSVPYRDVFHLRGPLELYIPAWLMKYFGTNVSVLEAYFYAGNVLTLIVFVFIARQMLKTRLVFYCWAPVFIARTFPRVAFTLWGGLRFCFGAMALCAAITFFKCRKARWMAAAGVLSGLSFLISLDAGACSVLSILLTLAMALILAADAWRWVVRAFLFYLGGFIFVVGMMAGYLAAHGAFQPWMGAMYSVTVIMTKVFPDSLVTENPATLLDAITGLSPFSPYFKHMTPAYCYIFLSAFAIFRSKKAGFRQAWDFSLLCLFFYGVLLYIIAFRKLGSSAFEMALQPEKILLFIMIEFILISLWNDYSLWKEAKREGRVRPGKSRWGRWKPAGIFLIGFFFVGSSWGYSIQRFHHRFFAVRFLSALLTGKSTESLKPLAHEPSIRMNIDRARGMVLPTDQAEDIIQLTAFIDRSTRPNEPVLLYPELGSYSFLIGRPFVGRFPMASFSWFGLGWHEEFVHDLKTTSPRFVVMPKQIAPHFEELYFLVPENRQRYNEVMDYIINYYNIVQETPSLLIYEEKNTF